LKKPFEPTRQSLMGISCVADAKQRGQDAAGTCGRPLCHGSGHDGKNALDLR
jgi:hypothetical protein